MSDYPAVPCRAFPPVPLSLARAACLFRNRRSTFADRDNAMNSRPLSLGILAASACILAFVAVRRFSAVPSSTPSAAPGTTASAIQEPATPGGAAAAEAALKDFRWSAVENDDYRKFVANLRGVGCPEATIRDIIVSEMNRLYGPREQPIRNAIAAASHNLGAADMAARRHEYELRKQLRDVEREKNAAVKDLLGIDLRLAPLRGWHPRDYARYENALDNLPAGKREPAREILEAYWSALDQLNDSHAGGRDQAYIDAYRRIDTEQRELLGAVLTPHELASFEMMCSPITRRLARNVSGLKLTEAEFEELFRIRREVDTPFGGNLLVASTDEEGSEKHQELEGKAQERLRDLLGEERYNAYVRETDKTWRQVQKIGARFDMPSEKVELVYESARKLQNALQKAASVQTIPEAELEAPGAREKINAQLTQLAAEAARLQASLKKELPNERAWVLLNEYLPDMEILPGGPDADGPK